MYSHQLQQPTSVKKITDVHCHLSTYHHHLLISPHNVIVQLWFVYCFLWCFTVVSAWCRWNITLYCVRYVRKQQRERFSQWLFYWHRSADKPVDAAVSWPSAHVSVRLCRVGDHVTAGSHAVAVTLSSKARPRWGGAICSMRGIRVDVVQPADICGQRENTTQTLTCWDSWTVLWHGQSALYWSEYC